MMRPFRFAYTFLAVCLVLTGSAFSQGLPTGTLTGRVMNEGQPLPGVSVTARAPTLQGSRTVATASNGNYAIVNLPPGDYTVTFEFSGFQKVTKTAKISAAQSSSVDAVLSLSAVEVNTVVVAAGEQVSETHTQATTYTSELLNKLPVARTLASAVALAPGVNANGPAGAFTISGAQSFDNNILVNGVNVQDNIRGTPRVLFIEDAIAETTTSTSGISAEYGRFQGGVINTITKSGGNTFSGSARVTLNNDAWVARTAFNENRVQLLTPTYEATLGGPIWKDRVWFFGAARIPKDATTAFLTSAPASIPYTYGFSEHRYEGKLTLSPLQNHTLTGSYIRIDREETNYAFNITTPGSYNVYDLDSVYARQTPEDLISGNYNGVLTDKLFAEAQYSQRHFTFENAGSRFTDLIKGTVLHSQAGGIQGYYNSPIFCGVCPGNAEKRDNEDILVKGTYFLSSPGIGSHSIALGFDDFAGKRLSNNYQSGSSYFINGTNAIFKNGDIFPVIDSSSYLGFYPVPNLAESSDTRTYSFYVNDSWKLNNNLSFNLGVRYDKNHAKDSQGAVKADDSDFSPRLAATFDPSGKGNLRFSASYARYVGAIQDTQAGAATGFGAPALYYYAYYGPEINTDPTGTLLTRAQAIQAVFDYYGITAPNQFPSKHAEDLLGATVPGLNTLIRGSLESPGTDEFAVGMSGNLGSKGNFRVDGVYRNAHKFYSTRTDLSTGQIDDAFGTTYDIGLVENVDAPLERKYYGLNVQLSYKPMAGLNVGGNWTWSHTYGNFVGENAGSGSISALVLQYPEYKELRWNSPNGDLLQDQRHKIRVFATYDLPVPKAIGNVGFSVLQAYDTGTPYGAVGQVRSASFVPNPGYATPPTGSGSPTYYYTARDAFRYDDIARTDFALNYSHSIGPVEIFVQPQVLNAFGNQALISSNTTVNSNVQSANLLNFNPFTTTPKECPQGTALATCKTLGANWEKGANFGKARSGLDYQLPRTFRLTMGLRF